jgi:hypothetical protein
MNAEPSSDSKQHITMSAPSKERTVVQPAWLTGDANGDGNGSGNSASYASSGSNLATSGLESAKGPLFKPKFTPKVPVKKESNTAAQSIPAAAG